MRPPRENLCGAFCHLFNVIPVWGMIFCAVMWYALREESRRVVEAARQAMLFHGALLVALLVWMLVGLALRVLTPITPGLADFAASINDGMMTIVYAVYAFICLLGGARLATGGVFRYPLIGGKGESGNG
jgi:uncharacterized Tic20 family protein